MKDIDFGKIGWTVLKVLFFLFVASALLVLLASILGAILDCLNDNVWVSWTLFIAFLVGMAWYELHKDDS